MTSPVIVSLVICQVPSAVSAAVQHPEASNRPSSGYFGKLLCPPRLGKRRRGRRRSTTLSLSAPAMIALSAIAAISAVAAVLARRSIRARLARCCQLFLRGRREKRLSRQADLAGVRLDRDHLHFHFVAELEQIRDLTDARVR